MARTVINQAGATRAQAQGVEGGGGAGRNGLAAGAPGAPPEVGAQARDAIGSVNGRLAENPNHAAPAARAKVAGAPPDARGGGAGIQNEGRPDAGRPAKGGDPGRPAGLPVKINPGLAIGHQKQGGHGPAARPVIMPQTVPNRRPDGEYGGKAEVEKREAEERRPTLGEEQRVGEIRSRAGERGVARAVANEILREADVYLGRRESDRILGGERGKSPDAVRILTDRIEARVGADGNRGHGKLVREIAREIGRELGREVESARAELTSRGALTFQRLNAAERLHAAASMLPDHVPEKPLEAILGHRSHEVVGGMLLARGIVATNANPAEFGASLASAGRPVLADWPPTALRDVGRLVASLMGDSTAARTSANLDVAVRKFVRLLLANNELGVLLATIDLAAEASEGSSALSRSLALAKIYDLIGRLVTAGEKTLGETSGRNVMLGDDGADEFHAAARRDAETAAAAARQFLEFNPNHRFDQSASAFFDPSEARDAQRDFAASYDAEIEAWLRSGNHRLVKDMPLDRPLGVVVERGGAAFEASVARFVLVRDGSVRGWHFLRTMLVGT